MRRILVLSFLLLLVSGRLFAYSDTKVILVAGRSVQPDSLGYNLVAELSANVYNWIQNGSITLWDSPEKKYAIRQKDLAGLESSTRTQFSSSANVFLYETWASAKNKFRFTIKGFSFTNENARGEEVMYGYVEFSPVLEALLKKTAMRTNANGSFGTTLLQALMNKGFEFTVVYFGGSAMADARRSLRIQREAMDPEKKQLNAMPVPMVKEVEYVIEGGPALSARQSRKILEEVQAFFRLNPQEYYNSGGERISSHLRKTTILITEIRVIEQWHWESGIIKFKNTRVIPYVVGVPLDTLTAAQLSEWGLKIGGRPVERVLEEKEFYFQIVRINDTAVPEPYSEGSRLALMQGRWDTLLQYLNQQKPY